MWCGSGHGPAAFKAKLGQWPRFPRNYCRVQRVFLDFNFPFQPFLKRISSQKSKTGREGANSGQNCEFANVGKMLPRLKGSRAQGLKG